MLYFMYMENMKGKSLWTFLAVVLIVAGVVFLLMNRKPALAPGINTNLAIGGESGDIALDANLGNVGIEDISAGSVNAGKPAPTISYAGALAKYKNARIQLDKMCQAVPHNVTYKNGANIMIDNRAPIARTVKIGAEFSIKAWGFKIVKISSAKLPATWLIDCDKSQNVATILIQK